MSQRVVARPWKELIQAAMTRPSSAKTLPTVLSHLRLSKSTPRHDASTALNDVAEIAAMAEEVLEAKSALRSSITEAALLADSPTEATDESIRVT